MGHNIKQSSATKLACLQAQLADEISASIAASLDNLDIAMRANDVALLRRVKGELISAKNLATILSANLKPEPANIVREAPAKPYIVAAE